MDIVIVLTPAEEARLSAAARQKGVTSADFAHQLVTEHLPPAHTAPDIIDQVPPGEAQTSSGEIDAENAAAIALLESWRREEATDDPEEIRKAEEELDMFKRSLNANREATGERLLFP